MVLLIRPLKVNALCDLYMHFQQWYLMHLTILRALVVVPTHKIENANSVIVWDAQNQVYLTPPNNVMIAELTRKRKIRKR